MLPNDKFELTEAQKRIWYTQMLYPKSSMYNIGGVARIKGKIDVDCLKKAICDTIHLYDALSIKIVNDGGRIMQYFDVGHEPDIKVVDFSHEEEAKDIYERWLHIKQHELFDMCNQLLYEIVILKFNDKEFGYFIKMHHIISDGWSIQMFTQKMCNYYDALYNQVTIDKSDIPYSYRDYIVSENEYLNSSNYQKSEQFWLNEFKDDFCTTTRISNDVLGKRISYEMEQNISNDIYGFCKSRSISLNTFFISIYLMAHSFLYDIDDIIVSIPLLGRNSRVQMKTFGMFATLVPLRYRIDMESTYSDYLDNLNTKLKAIYLRQRYPYNHLIKALENQSKQFHMLNAVCVNYYNTLPSVKIQGFDIISEEFYNGEQDYSLQLIIRDWNDKHCIHLDFDYKTSVYSDEDIHTVNTVMNVIIEQILGNPLVTIKKINLISDETKYHLLDKYNKTICCYPKDKAVIELILEQAAITPERIAIEEKERKLTYEQLVKKISQFAQYLIEQGVSQNDIVCLVMTNSIESVVAILAIMRIGAAYCPIDISYPPNRIEYILKTTEARIIVSNIEKIHRKYKNVLLFNDVINFSYTVGVFSKSYNPEDTVYVIFTSGSTGNPKGVMVKNIGLTNYVCWAKKQYIDDIETFPLFTSLAFDLTVTSLFTPLISGGKIKVYNNEQNHFPLFQILDENACTIMKLTPAHLLLIANEEYASSTLKKFIVGGDNLSAHLAQKIYNMFGRQIEIYNEYGPTETAVGCMIHKFDPTVEIEGSVSIGRPIDNMQIYLLNSNMKPLPINMRGEIYISGAGVAKGYLKNDSEYRKRFVKNPFLENQIMYRTGDIGIFTDSQNMQYIAREDNQIQLNGYRIELAEIELCIREYTGINEVLVMKSEENTAELTKLIAYYTAEEEINETALREHCLQKLPHYMCPACYIQLKEFLLTANGKIDKTKLPAASAVMISDDIDKNADKFSILTDSLKHVLGDKEMLPESNFFHLGGDSISAIQVSSRLIGRGITLHAKDILLYPVLRDMVCYMTVEKKEEKKQELCCGEIENTPIVEWFIKQKFNNPDNYNNSITLRINFSIENMEALKKILYILIAHHDSLRINYNTTTNKLFYNNKHLDEEMVIELFDLSTLSAHKYKDRMKQIRYQMHSAFRIDSSLLVKTCVIKNREAEYFWILTFHHLVIDEVSIYILLNDINCLLEKMSKKQELDLNSKTASYLEWSQFVNRQRHIVQSNGNVYNTGEDRSYTVPYSKDGTGECNKVVISRSVQGIGADDLLVHANSGYHTTAEELVIAAFVKVLYIRYPQKCIVLHIENNGRDLEEIDVSRTIGWFTSIYPVAFYVHEESFDALIKNVKETMRNVSHNRRFYSLFDSENDSTQVNHGIKLNYSGQAYFKTEYMEILSPINDDDTDENNISTYDLEVNIIIFMNQIYVNAVFDSRKYKTEQIQQLLAEFCEQIADIVNYCIHKNTIAFTPSDFEALDITQEELDSLFDE